MAGLTAVFRCGFSARLEVEFRGSSAGTLYAYVLGRLSLDHAFARLFARTGVAAGPVVLPWPEAVVEMDTVEDLVLVEEILGAGG